MLALTSARSTFMTNLPRIFGLVLAIPIILIYGTPVFAQSNDSGDGNALEEVIVTAERRTESLQNVPMAVTAFSGESLREIGAHILSDVAERTPNFTIGVFNLGQPSLTIRGIGSNSDGAGADSSVVAFIDGVYIGRQTATNLDLYDLERFEVLRGPQGTLYGKNVIGGALNLTTSQPTDTLTGKFELTAGNLGQWQAQGLISGPLSDRISGKLAFTARKRDGYIHSVDPSILGAEFSDIESTGVRGGLRILASDTVEINFAADYSWDRWGAAGHHVSGLGDPLLVPSLSIPNAQFAYDPVAYADIYSTFSDKADGYQNRDVWGLSARINWDVGDGQFHSITAYRGADYTFNEDVVGTGFVSSPVITVEAFIDEQVDQFTQEFRFNRTDFDNRLYWTVGVFYLDETIDRQEDSGAALFVPRSQMPWDSSLQYNNTKSWSMFADATYSITERFDLTLGGRYTDEKKDIRQVAIEGPCGACGINGPYDVSASQSWNAFTPRVVLGFHINDDDFLYASYNEGFKSGGFEGLANNAVNASTPFDPEFAKAYEVGFKSEWLDHHLRINTALFRTDYSDLQVLERIVSPEFPVGILVTKNAGKAKIDGVEVEVTSQWGGFGLNGSYAYLNTDTSEFGAPNDPRNGKELTKAPNNSYYLEATYDWSLENGGNVNFRWDLRHKDRAFADPTNMEGAAVPAYTVQDIRLAYSSAGGRWEFAAWVRNLTNEEYLLHAWPGVPFGFIQTPAPPRMYGVTYSMRFGN